MELPSLRRDEIPDLLEEYAIEIRSKSNPFWIHLPVVWASIAIVWITGGSPRSYCLCLPVPFTGRAIVYLHGGYDVEDVRRGDFGRSLMPLLIHELTHAFQVLELGAFWYAAYYLAFPFPAFWTGRATLEWEADGNEILWLRSVGVSTAELQKTIFSAAELYTGPRYVWPTLRFDAWRRATVALFELSAGDARDFSYLTRSFGYDYR